MNQDREKINGLIEYVKGIKDNLNGAELYLKYKSDIENVKPQEAFEVFYALLEEGMEPKEVLVFLDKIINVFYKSLSHHQWERPANDNFLVDLILENEALFERAEEIKIDLKEENLEIKKEKLIPKVKALEAIKHHYLKKENILFPYLEKTMEKFHGLKIMWALHDEVRNRIQETVSILQSKESDEKEVNGVIGKLFFGILGVAKKENLILFPAASEVLSPQDWYDMHKQSLEYEFSFIEKAKEEIEMYRTDSEGRTEVFEGEYKLKTETGELSLEQVAMIFNALPVDMTFVDENNKVRYFTRPKDRIFPRSPAIIGRDVNNCHPPDSVHIVQKIIEGFRTGQKDSAKFWIELKGKMILIQYFALRDAKGIYRGTLEVSQDITEIRGLEGQRRLLDWD
ncbi:DUF438 domain-containing protein [Alkaliphilus oremlandii]|uniref:Putative PAS/PAC sensor protein n=1 Tax=Alkaliphilus oremlandii (strain OhILAs) TaxID=350688 RepID=A8MEH3_ALKOO|nr:PAS domain-containing protein [Alkaliphilus oremlandii]ABW17644.1 putative PAS/PAC sensor protein [Alkaliphilus oremlandii OhILAs]